MKKDYSKLLENAPAHDSPEFIDYLRENNNLVWENPQWIVIVNCKYHTKEKPWYTAFHKTGGAKAFEWYADIDILAEKFGDWEWLKKSADRQTVNRFHIHLYKP